MESSRTTSVRSPTGPTTLEAEKRLGQFGPNRVEQERRHPLLALVAKFWAPVPWMLEATVVLEVLVRKHDEAIIIASLLVFNAILSFTQENQANRALSLLRARLSVQARDWNNLPRARGDPSARFV